MQRWGTSPTQQAAATQAAIALQTAVLIGVTSADRGPTRDLILNATVCLMTTFGSTDGAKVWSELQTNVVDNEARVRAYLDFHRLLPGQGVVLPRTNTCQ